jgi:Na+/H+ antiporter NhaD/arsenite permease-like protein
LTHLFKETIFAILFLLAVFFLIDSHYYRQEKNRSFSQTDGQNISIEGGLNLFLLATIIGTILVSSIDFGIAATVHDVPLPTATILQVSLMVVITFISLIITPTTVRTENEFGWEPIREVAKIFAAIFITMVTPIAMLKAGVDGPLGFVMSSLVEPNGGFINSRFFWATGSLSSFLDNAPTYIVFFEAAGGKATELMTTHARTLSAISIGAVFMGANSYIGNAPNFMVRSIAEQSGVPMPSFFGYIIKYAIPILLPLFVLITILFF